MSHPLTRPSLLVVEDHEDYAQYLIGLLGGEWRIAHARSIAETEQEVCRVGGGAFDLVLADLTLPNGQGMDILRKVRACIPETTRVVVLTIHNDSIVQSEAMRYADDYLVKDAPGLDIPGRLRLALQRTQRGSTPMKAPETIVTPPQADRKPSTGIRARTTTHINELRSTPIKSWAASILGGMAIMAVAPVSAGLFPVLGEGIYRLIPVAVFLFGLNVATRKALIRFVLDSVKGYREAKDPA